MKNRKLSYPYSAKKPGVLANATRAEDFAIYASYQINAGGLFEERLKELLEKPTAACCSHSRLHPVLGPYPTRQEAREAAVIHGEQIVAIDIANPED